MTVPSPMRQYRPREMTTDGFEPAPDLRRSPRMIEWGWMMVLPPRMMFCGPWIVAIGTTRRYAKAGWERASTGAGQLDPCATDEEAQWGRTSAGDLCTTNARGVRSEPS